MRKAPGPVIRFRGFFLLAFRCLPFHHIRTTRRVYHLPESGVKALKQTE